MNSRDFCYWAKGYFELAGTKATLNAEQIEVFKRHLNMVFAHEIDPSFGKDKEELNKIHNRYSDGISDIKITC